MGRGLPFSRAMSAPGLIDTRLLRKPRVYGGNRAEWTAWKYVMKMYASAVDAALLGALEAAESSATPLELLELNPAAQGHSRTLAYILSQVLTNGPLQLAMNCGGNGLEAWRQLVKQEEPTSGAAQVTTLATLLAAKFTGNLNEFVGELQKFEGLVQTYELRYGEVLPDALHQALLKNNTPAAIRAQVELATFASARSLKDALIGYVQVQLAAGGGAKDEPVPMDVGYVGGKGGKKGAKNGKGKSSGKTKKDGGKKGFEKSQGKSAQNTTKKFDGNCNYCGRYGHRAKDCWSNQRSVSEVAQEQPAGGSAEESTQGRPGGAVAAVHGDEGWIFAVFEEVNAVSGIGEGILVDSGAWTHVAPKDYAKHVEAEELIDGPVLHSVTGKRLKTYGLRKVRYVVENEHGEKLLVMVEFVVADVRRPVISSTDLVDKGFKVVFENPVGYVEKFGTRVALRRVGKAYMPQAAFAQDANTMKMKGQST